MSSRKRPYGEWRACGSSRPPPAAFYKPISPRQHDYLDIPGFLLLAMVLPVVVGLILRTLTIPRWLRVWSVLTVLGLSGAYEQPQRGLRCSYATLGQVLRGHTPITYPSGYVGSYPLSEYEGVLAYIKGRANQRASIANALAYPLALTGPTARLSAFPAESMAWLRWVRPDDEDAFVRKLEDTPESIVVWCPAEFERELSAFRRLETAIRRLYEPECRFSDIEIWRRRCATVESTRSTNREAWVQYKGQEVWGADPATVGIFDGVNTQRDGAFQVKTIANQSDD